MILPPPAFTRSSRCSFSETFFLLGFSSRVNNLLQNGIVTFIPGSCDARLVSYHWFSILLVSLPQLDAPSISNCGPMRKGIIQSRRLAPKSTFAIARAVRHPWGLCGQHMSLFNDVVVLFNVWQLIAAEYVSTISSLF